MSPATDEKYEVCMAQRQDLDQIIALLSDDPLGRVREHRVHAARVGTVIRITVVTTLPIAPVAVPQQLPAASELAVQQE